MFTNVNNFTLSSHRRKKKQGPKSHVINPMYTPTTSTLLILVIFVRLFPGLSKHYLQMLYWEYLSKKLLQWKNHLIFSKVSVSINLCYYILQLLVFMGMESLSKRIDRYLEKPWSFITLDCCPMIMTSDLPRPFCASCHAVFFLLFI